MIWLQLTATNCNTHMHMYVVFAATHCNTTKCNCNLLQHIHDVHKQRMSSAAFPWLVLTKYHCNTLAATHCNTLQRTATHCNAPQHINVNAEQAADTTRGIPVTRIDKISLQHARCNTLQRTATHCNALQHTATHKYKCGTGCRYYAWHSRDSYWQNITATRSLQHTATHCNALQCTATHCNTLQRTATYCNALQRTATHKCKCISGCRYYAWHSRDSYWQNITATRSLQHTATMSGCRYYAWHSRDSYWSLRLFLSWYDWQTGVSWLPLMCVMTPSYVRRDSFVCVTWLIHICDMTRIDAYAYSFFDATGKLVCHDSLICVSWLPHMCVVTHSYAWHDSSIYVTWLVLMPTPILFLMRLARWCVMTPSYVCHDWFICVSWLIRMCDMAHPYMWRDSYWYPRYPSLDATGALVCHDSLICVSWLPHMCVMTPSYVCHDSLIFVSWLRDMRVMIHVHVYCVMTHSNLCHDLFIRVSCCSVLRCCTSTNLLARGKKKVFAVLFLMRVPQQSHLLKSNSTGIYRLCSKAYSKMMFVGASSPNRHAVVDGKRSKIAKSVWALVLYLPPKNAEIAFETPRTPLFTYSWVKLPCFYWTKPLGIYQKRRSWRFKGDFPTRGRCVSWHTCLVYIGVIVSYICVRHVAYMCVMTPSELFIGTMFVICVALLRCLLEVWWWWLLYVLYCCGVFYI